MSKEFGSDLGQQLLRRFDQVGEVLYQMLLD